MYIRLDVHALAKAVKACICPSVIAFSKVSRLVNLCTVLLQFYGEPCPLVLDSGDATLSILSWPAADVRVPCTKQLSLLLAQLYGLGVCEVFTYFGTIMMI